MRTRIHLLTILLVTAALVSASGAAQAKKISVVVTSSAYDSITRAVGGDKVEVVHIVKGYQDPHVVRPKPSLAVQLSKADLFVATGMDLEMWAPALVNMSNNPKIRSGQVGYVSASAGVKISEKPITISRAEGDVHIYGNPHIHTSPLNGKVIAQNICVGLKKAAPEHAALFDANLRRFIDEIDRRTFGAELTGMLGGKVLTKLAQRGSLIPFLQKKQYKGRALIDRLGGWMKQALPLRGRKVVTYHKNWGYFTDLVGLEVVDYMEPKPGIPPTPGHVASVINTMRKQKIRVLLAANYFDVGKVNKVAGRVGAIPVVIALSPGGEKSIPDFLSQFDVWISRLVTAFKQSSPTS